MLFREVVDLWEQDNSETTTIVQFRGKIRKYLKSNFNMTIDEALNENRIFDFIFADDKQSAKGKYNALYNIYKYTNEKILLKNEFEFPIKIKDVNEFDDKESYKTKRISYETVFLNDDFDFKELFNNKYYEHLNEEKAIITVKAIISLALSTGLGKGDLLKDTGNNYLKINDVNLMETSQVEVNINGKNINKIVIPEESAKYIIEYIKIRKKIIVNDDAFFVKLWDGYKLMIDTRIVNKKPSDINNLVLYVLKYISNSLGIEELKINDLRANKVYHELISSRGSALNSIIRLHGYSTFVEEVYQKFISKYDSDICVGFDFFNKASSPLELDVMTLDKIEVGNDDEAIPETFMAISEKKKRNRKIVEELKKLYKNKCQICGEFIDMGNGIKYSEVHHIHPIGKEHNGVDNKYNMIVLCPNHHKMFDLGILSINPVDCQSVVHIDKNNLLNNVKIKFNHLVSETYIRYHYEHIFLKLMDELKR